MQKDNQEPFAVIGIDEAGYGPRIGPLVIAATVWKVTTGTCSFQEAWLRQAWWQQAHSVLVDSKQLYKSRRDFDTLQARVVAACRMLRLKAKTSKDIWQSLCPKHITRAGLPWESKLSWYQEFSWDKPCNEVPQEIEATIEIFRTLGENGSELSQIVCRPVLVPEFNRLVCRAGSKATVLSRLTLELLRNILCNVPEKRIHVLCDKHGGRNNYAGFLTEVFGGLCWPEGTPGRERSCYQVMWNDKQIRIEFCSKGERYPPVALASLCAKYLRESAMQAFNYYWCSKRPSLQPTAGYPADAARFLHDINDICHAGGIDQALFWRVK